MKLIKCVIAGLVAGAVGAAIWAVIAVTTEHEIGWIAWGVGGLVGIAVRLASQDVENGALPGIVAVLIAVASIGAGKFLAVNYLVERDLGKMLEDAHPTDEQMIVGLADQVAEEYASAGKTLEWPAGQSVETAESATDYPKDVWAEAKTRYEAQPVAERNAEKAKREQEMREMGMAMKDMLRNQLFKQSFSGIDILFFLLAVATAFRIASGNSTSN